MSKGLFNTCRHQKFCQKNESLTRKICVNPLFRGDFIKFEGWFDSPRYDQTNKGDKSLHAVSDRFRTNQVNNQ